MQVTAPTVMPVASGSGGRVNTTVTLLWTHDDWRVTISPTDCREGFISRYLTDVTDDSLPGSEGQFLGCSFRLVEALALNGREAGARKLLERLAALRSDLGLCAEEYDVARGGQVGNFPQAFTHLA